MPKKKAKIGRRIGPPPGLKNKGKLPPGLGHKNYTKIGRARSGAVGEIRWNGNLEPNVPVTDNVARLSGKTGVLTNGKSPPAPPPPGK